jgi:hypothetical protein
VISALWLILIIPMAGSVGAVIMALIAANRNPDEDILAEACDHCHWCYVLEDKAELDEKCKNCPIGRVPL